MWLQAVGWNRWNPISVSTHVRESLIERSRKLNLKK